ncbi:MAG: hypothetical protein JHC93_05850 [Parachlamydiales bacterium]|nr:hypothetical protein [Parachlamydiales bacterium]
MSITPYIGHQTPQQIVSLNNSIGSSQPINSLSATTKFLFETMNSSVELFNMSQEKNADQAKRIVELENQLKIERHQFTTEISSLNQKIKSIKQVNQEVQDLNAEKIKNSQNKISKLEYYIEWLGTLFINSQRSFPYSKDIRIQNLSLEDYQSALHHIRDCVYSGRDWPTVDEFVKSKP